MLKRVNVSFVRINLVKWVAHKALPPLPECPLPVLSLRIKVVVIIVLGVVLQDHRGLLLVVALGEQVVGELLQLLLDVSIVLLQFDNAGEVICEAFSGGCEVESFSQGVLTLEYFQLLIDIKANRAVTCHKLKIIASSLFFRALRPRRRAPPFSFDQTCNIFFKSNREVVWIGTSLQVYNGLNLIFLGCRFSDTWEERLFPFSNNLLRDIVAVSVEQHCALVVALKHCQEDRVSNHIVVAPLLHWLQPGSLIVSPIKNLLKSLRLVVAGKMKNCKLMRKILDMMRINTMHLKVQSGLVQMVFDVITFEESLCLRA